MPGMYPEGEYDLAGFAVGAVEKKKIIDGSSIAAGDRILGLASSGAHSNGYSLIRKIIERAQARPSDSLNGQRLEDVVMAPTRIYVKSMLHLMQHCTVKGMAHITGGGLVENVPALFQWLQQQGGVEDAEMHRVFNCGIGMVVILAADQIKEAKAILEAQGETVYELGEVVARPAGAHQTIVV